MPKPEGEAAARGRWSEFFFVQVGSFVAVAVYFAVLAAGGSPQESIYLALPVALAVMVVYSLVASQRGLLKQFDPALVALFTLGTVAAYAGSDTAVSVASVYPAVALFVTLGLVASIPVLLGREPFTVFFALRNTPRWQHGTPEFTSIAKIVSLYFGFLFFAAAALVAVAPHDLRFSLIYPNLLIFVAGIPSQFWLPPLYMKIFPPAAPQTVEAAIMGMPFSFDSRAARGVEATIEFRVTGESAGCYHLAIENGKCESREGEADGADLTITTPGSVWLDIARGELDGRSALERRLYSAAGDYSILLRLDQWFPRRSRSA